MYPEVPHDYEVKAARARFRARRARSLRTRATWALLASWYEAKLADELARQAALQGDRRARQAIIKRIAAHDALADAWSVLQSLNRKPVAA